MNDKPYHRPRPNLTQVKVSRPMHALLKNFALDHGLRLEEAVHLLFTRALMEAEGLERANNGAETPLTKF